MLPIRPADLTLLTPKTTANRFGSGVKRPRSVPITGKIKPILKGAAVFLNSFKKESVIDKHPSLSSRRRRNAIKIIEPKAKGGSSSSSKH